MAIDQQVVSPVFSGTKKFQTLASHIFELMRARGMFMADDTPIRVPLDELKVFLAERDSAKPADVDTAISTNPDVFAIDTVDDATFVVTTRVGRVPAVANVLMSHTFGQRFMTPQPKPERPVVIRKEPVRVDPNWATYSVPDYIDDEEEEAFSAQAEAERVVEPPVILTPPSVLEVVEQVVEPVVPENEVPELVAVDEVEPQVADAPPVIDRTPIVEEPVAAPEVEAEPVPEVEIEAVVEPEPEPIVEPEPVAATPPAPAPAPVLSDLTGIDDDVIAMAIETQLGTDANVARFADLWMVEERVPRLSRGELRRIKDYIEEQEQPLSDAVLVTDILNVRPNAVDFDLLRFAVSYRLSREHRDFEFVGTSGQRFWSTSSLPQIGTTRRKPNEIGTDYRYLTEAPVDTDQHRSIQSVDHVLSFYEFSLGLLPYDSDIQRLLPAPVNADQRSAVLTFEIPQSYTTYLVELRYPTPNRGGFLLGLDDLYAENLVPGAMISISATENDGHYKVEFLSAKDQSARLLELDDRRSPRYQFRPTTYACEVAPEWLISEDRFPRLGSEKPLDDKVRRRPDSVVAATFERIGLDDDGGLIATFDDVLAAVNIERPFSPALLSSTIDADTRITDDGSGTLTYVAGS